MSSQILKKPIPYLVLLFAHLIWGANFVVAKVTLQEFPPMSLAFLRFAFASLLLAPFFLAETKKVKIDKKDLP
ncbi:DMT family transporter, partial [Patescibacteria group bacterium]|nr:DMT family transporter [Patescibacteria group bacterium]